VKAPAHPSRRRSLGVIVPSANVVVERAAIQLSTRHGGVDFHLTRVPMRGGQDPNRQNYDIDVFVAAAELLADAKPQGLFWAGSKGVLAGAEAERKLQVEIESRFGLPFTSCTLALIALLKKTALKRVGLITPYTDAYQRVLIAGLRSLGLDCVAEAHAGIADNFDCAGVPAAQIVAMAKDVAVDRPDAVLAWCTNFASADHFDLIRSQIDVPFIDATLLGFEHAIALLEGDVPLAQEPTFQMSSH
jgi:maleate isomerase